MIAEVQNWFESCITQSYANPRAENIVLVSKSETTKESLIHALNDVGIDLSGYRYDEDSKHLFTQRTINGKVYELPFEAESDGTKKMIAALPVLMVALQEGQAASEAAPVCDSDVQEPRTEQEGRTTAIQFSRPDYDEEYSFPS